jgi:hypothetical protein
MPERSSRCTIVAVVCLLLLGAWAGDRLLTKATGPGDLAGDNLGSQRQLAEPRMRTTRIAAASLKLVPVVRRQRPTRPARTYPIYALIPVEEPAARAARSERSRAPPRI